ncbi:MAG: hypothetical protein RIT81_17825 [Deltaproteobacteria bacterium]
MALDLTGIDNVGEFYSHHYLETLLEGDLKSTFARWRQDDKDGKGRSPARKLHGLANRYFSAVASASEASEPEARWSPLRDLHVRLLKALGYEYAPQAVALEDGTHLPVLLAEARDGNPWLWVIDAPLPDGDDDSALDLAPLAAQLPKGEGSVPDGRTWRELFRDVLFERDPPPRWILFFAGREILLVERSKWGQGQFLRFDLDAIFGRREQKALRATAGLLHRDVLNPDTAACLHDSLDDKSHKHAFAVSTDLKHGAREAVELIANEALHYKRTTSKDKVFGIEGQAEALTRESLIFLYRLLFLFYVEARGGEAGVVPMQSDAFRLGYSLESLRDLEQVPLTTPQSLDGFYIHESLKKLFTLVNRGFPTARQLGLSERDDAKEGERFAEAGFAVPGVKSALFDPEQTPLLSSVRLRNRVLQKVIERLSLSEPGRRNSTRGRISYAQLGINQLGAVYEGLLSYRGFFAETELFEVRDPQDDDKDARAFFVEGSELSKFSDEEIVRGEDDQPVSYAPGTYLFRLAGRDREKSASYYTPEVLTRCLTKYTLKTRLGDPLMPDDEDGPEPSEKVSADEMLRLTILEPAMGSGAFLVEATNQLADRYLEAKQEEIGRRIPPEDYQYEKQRVKAYITARNVYGVDLNPLAAELGKISLWLNVLHEGARAPYLDARLAVGNSLIGGRRQVFTAEQLDPANKKGSRWLDVVPAEVPLGPDGERPHGELAPGVARRPPDSVYHFLLPDEGMVPFDKDKVVKGLVPDDVAALKAWRKAACAKLTAEEAGRLVVLSDRIDALFVQHVDTRRRFLDALEDDASVWPKLDVGRKPFSEEVGREEHAMHLGGEDTPGRRLSAVMDVWCALWFWPVRESASLPSREAWWDAVEALLESRVEAKKRYPWLAVVERVAERIRFHHWWVVFSEVFVERLGFDLILGNPPWVKIEWEEAAVLGDFAPEFVLRKLPSSLAATRRPEVLSDEIALASYLESFEETLGKKSYLGATSVEPVLVGLQANLYKSFIVGGWRWGCVKGVQGILHQPGIFEDSSGDALREELFSRLVISAVFQNQMKLFEDVGNARRYCFTVCRSLRGEVNFVSFSGLQVPSTIEESLRHDGVGAVPGVKSEQGKWETRGHKSRAVVVSRDALAVFAKLFGGASASSRGPRLPLLYTDRLSEVLSKLASVPVVLADLCEALTTSECFHETNAQKDGTITRSTIQPADASELMFSGPHFFVSTPFFKNPNEGCRSHRDYTCVDLSLIEPDFLPRTNYVRGCAVEEYWRRFPRWGLKSLSTYYRYVNRTMVDPSGERTLIPAIIPPGCAHVGPVFSVAFERDVDLLRFVGGASSIVADFLVKCVGKTTARFDVLGFIPVSTQLSSAISRRALRLNALTEIYSDLWRNNAHDMGCEAWSKDDCRLSSWLDCESSTWSTVSFLRNGFERRHALVELDALVALDLGLTLDELLAIYRVQFHVLQQYERETFYDRKGRIVFTVNKGLSGVGVTRAEWNQIKSAQAGVTLPSFAAQYVPPFDRCDREEDMTRAYRFFRPLLDGKPAGSPVADLTPPPPPPRKDTH